MILKKNDDLVQRQLFHAHLDKVDIIIELHGAGLDPEHLQPTLLVGDTDVQLAVEPAEPPEGRLDYVGAVGGSDDHHVRRRLDAVHEGEKLRHDALLDLPSGLVPPRCDRVWKKKKKKKKEEKRLVEGTCCLLCSFSYLGQIID